MKTIEVGIIGTGWCGGIRAAACAASSWVQKLHLAEINEGRLKEVSARTHPDTSTTDYHVLLRNPQIDAIIISTTPETSHYPVARESLLAGKHVLLEKPL
ncbi:MAG TPA: Gfo/Idh/MocA family oxidoreductase, partial [Terriglobales bacterium]|nr:Gfo/Idh/MocA family oxidoreductase [Terriglobales bacterium]